MAVKKTCLCKLLTHNKTGQQWDLNWLGMILTSSFVVTLGHDEHCFVWFWSKHKRKFNA